MREAIEQQLDELECVLSMFPGPDELHFDAELKAQYERYLCLPPSAAETPPEAKLEYAIRLQNHRLGSHVPELEIKYPHEYPTAAQVEFIVHCSWLPRDQMERLQTELLCISTGNDGEIVVLQLYQCMADLLDEWLEAAKSQAQQKEQSTGPPTRKAPELLGRRAIYFHHIISSTKRRVLKEWALELGLGGFSKIGWPGVVIVEGDESNAQEYVRRLQHLRWKQMVVRGEQTETVESASGGTVDSMRRLPRGFCEFPESGMSEAAALCREAGLEELFLTVMKIYRPADEEGEEKLDAVSDRKVTGQKKRGNGSKR